MNLLPESISECALYLNKPDGEVCMSDTATNAIGSVLSIKGDKREVVDEAKRQLRCETERCVLEKLSPQLGYENARREILVNLKVSGPTDNTLLSNINIDSTLQQWQIKFSDFYPYSFNMLNYASYSYVKGRVVNQPDTLATVRFDHLYTGVANGKKHRCAGCVINTDTYQGAGKHWMALFADARGKSQWTVEFFNSSGGAPSPEWVNWMEKTRVVMEGIVGSGNIKVKSMRASSLHHQRSRSECGLYSLFYIWARLNGVPVEYFATNRISDQLMFEFRQHLFNDPNRKALKKFVWSEYKQTTKIEWE